MRNRTLEKKRQTAAVFLALCTIITTAIPTLAAPVWSGKGGADNIQGDKSQTGKTDTTGEAPVYGAIGNLDDRYSMDIDGDGNADITIPKGDLIEVSVTPSMVVNIYPEKAQDGKEAAIISTSAEGSIENQNTNNRLKVSLDGLEARDENAGQIKVTDETVQNAENGLSLSIYGKTEDNNAFIMTGECLGTNPVSLANAAQDPPVPIILGTLSEKGGAAPSGIYLLKGDCRPEFVEKYKDQPITYRAVYKFTIEN